MVRRGFMFLFWGFLLSFLDFRINGLDLLPDFVGYIIISAGLGTLSQWNIQFGKAKFYSLLLIFLSLPDLIVSLNQNMAIPYFILALIVTIFSVLLIWLVCQGIIEMAIVADKPGLADQAASRRKLVLAILLLTPCLIGLGTLDRKLGLILMIPILILLIVTVILVLLLMRRAALELPDEQPQEATLYSTEDGTPEEWKSESSTINEFNGNKQEPYHGSNQ